MTTFPRSPRVRKGAIIALDRFNPLASVIVFQYNPAQLTRTLTPQLSGASGAPAEAQRLAGPPEESISVTVEIDATDQLERGGVVAARLGIHPQLAALEMLLYPKSAVVIANAMLAQVGILEVVPAEAPLTLFVWGLKRVLPVRLSSFTITEQAYDTSLNPLRAEVSLDLRVLSYNDLPRQSPGYGLFLAHQVAKEAMASMAGAANLSADGLGRLF